MSFYLNITGLNNHLLGKLVKKVKSHLSFSYRHNKNSFLFDLTFNVTIFSKEFFREKSVTYQLKYCNVSRMSTEPAHEIMVLIKQATSEGSCEPAHPHSVSRTFAVPKYAVWK